MNSPHTNYMTQCHAKTLSGKRCKNSCQVDSRACHIKGHKLQVMAPEPALPPLQAKFPVNEEELYLLKQMPRMLTDFERVLDQRVRNEAGHLYIFRLQGDKDGPRMYKVGMTTQAVAARMQQWQSENTLPLRLLASYEVDNARMAERLTHLLLYDVRVRRYVVWPEKQGEKQFYSHWMYSNDESKLTTCPEDCPKHYKRHTKEVEWFHTPLAHIKDVVARVAAYVNK